MSGEIDIPLVLQMKNGINDVHVSNLKSLAQPVEDAHLYQYLANGTPHVDPVEHQMYIQSVAHIVNDNIQIIDGVQIVNDGQEIVYGDMEIIDGNIQIVESTAPDLNNKVPNEGDNINIISNNGIYIDKASVIDNPVQIVRTNGHSRGHILNTQKIKNNFKVINSREDVPDKNVQVHGSKVLNADVIKNEKEMPTFICEIVYPEQLNLQFKNMKRGRPKRKNDEPEEPEPVKVTKPTICAPKTRSGRVVRFPRHIVKDFKRAEFDETILENGERELKALDFIKYEEPPEELAENDVKKEPIELKFTKRTIKSQYRCPKCQKSYLGKSKMIQHIKKYPDHGPLPISRNENNFDVWNYLVDITQKCPPAQRGLKFCGELTNLLHNVLLLTSALFKEVEPNKTFVEVDKVLGNAIGLPSGQYKFNDSELYKDVTVMKLITNTDFFKPVSVSKETNKHLAKKIKEEVKPQKDNVKEVKDGTKAVEVKPSEVNCDIGVKTSNMEEMVKSTDKKEEIAYFNVDPKEKTAKEDVTLEYQSVSEPNTKSAVNIAKKDSEAASIPNDFDKKPLSSAPLDDRISVHQELLSENSLLHLPNLRSTVDDLILTGVDTGSALLDNSTSSDELMNVDQFVNERFKKITEPDMDISGGSLNLDLPPLDLFQFHTS